MRQIHADGIRVVLDGQGGDELLCGYAKYFYFAMLDLWHRRAAGDLALSLLRVARFGGLQLLNFDAARRYMPASWWMGKHQRTVLQPAFARDHADRVVAHPRADVNEQQRLDIERFSLPALLRYEDKNAMAHSIESRVPFLDHRLVEFALCLPTEQKIYGGESKRVLRLGLAEDVPAAILNRRSKLGFGGTYQSWLDTLQPELARWLSRPARRVDQYIVRDALDAMLRRRDANIWRALVLDCWLERFAS